MLPPESIRYLPLVELKNPLTSSPSMSILVDGSSRAAPRRGQATRSEGEGTMNEARMTGTEMIGEWRISEQDGWLTLERGDTLRIRIPARRSDGGDDRVELIAEGRRCWVDFTHLEVSPHPAEGVAYPLEPVDA